MVYHYSRLIFTYPKTSLEHYDLLQVLILGQPGEEVSLELILRVVADVGLVVSVVSHLIFHVCLRMPRQPTTLLILLYFLLDYCGFDQHCS